MEKIKNILRPGHAKDDEVMYGTNEAHTSVSGPSSSQPASQDLPEHLSTDPSAKKEHGILRQILNPGGEKYDEVAHGTTAHETPEDQGTLLRTDPGVQKHEHGVLRQILNPGGDKYDEIRYGTTAHSDQPLSGPTTGTPASKLDLPDVGSSEPIPDNHGVARQLLNPGGDKFNDLSYGEDPVAAAHRGSVAADNSTSHLGRDAAIGAGAVGGAGLAAHEVGKRNETIPASSTTPSSTAATTSTPAYTQSAAQPTTTWAPATTTSSFNQPSTSAFGSTSTGDRSFPLSGGTETTSSGLSTGPNIQAGHSELGRDAAIAGGVGAGAVGAGALAGHHQNAHADNVPVTSNTATTGTSSNLLGSSTATTNVPTSSTTSTAPITSSTNHDSHLGRDAAIGAGVGASAGALGATALATHNREEEPRDDISRATYTARSQYIGAGSSDPSTTHLHNGDELASSGLTAPLARTADDPSTISSTGAHPESGSLATSRPIGRDAAIVSDGTAASDPALAAYEKSLEPKPDVAAATYTYSAAPVGGAPLHHPNEKPVEGVVHHTSGPHALDIANRLDPHVPGEFPTPAGFDRHDGRLENREAGLVDGAGIGTLSNTQASDIPAITSTTGPSTTDSHLGRDAALGAGAGTGLAALAAREASTIDDTGASAPTTSTSSGALGTTGSSHTQPLADRTLASSDAPLAGSTAQTDPFANRNAAIGVGAGAAGIGAASFATHEASRSHDTTTSAHHAGGVEGTSSSSHTQPLFQTGAASSSTPLTSTSTSNAPHLGRDATLGAGAGAAGIGAYEAGKSHESTTQSSENASTVEPHKSSLLNKLDPRVKTDSATGAPTSTTGSDHYNSSTGVTGTTATGAPTSTTGSDNYTSSTGVTGTTATSTDPATIAAREALARHSGNEHNKLHKSDDPRGPTGASNVMHEHHERKLQEAREAEAAKHAPGAEKEKKPSIIQRILHPGHHKDHKDESLSSAHDTTAAPGTVIEPHTGLPANVDQYGSGVGGTDGSSTIPGVHNGGVGSSSTT